MFDIIIKKIYILYRGRNKSLESFLEVTGEDEE